MADAPESTQQQPEQQQPEQPHGDEQQPQEQPSLEDLTRKVAELTEHSRKWEARAKENFDKAKKYDEYLESQKTEEEKRADAAKVAEQRLADAEKRADAAELAMLRFKIAARHSISDEDAELFLTGTDEETLVKQAERLAERNGSRTPQPNPSQGHRSGPGAGASAGEQFAHALEELF